MKIFEKIAKISWIIALLFDIAGILISIFNFNISNTSFHKVWYKCSIYKTELLFGLLLLLIAFVFYYYIKYLSKKVTQTDKKKKRRIIIPILMLSLIVAIAFSYKELSLYVKARYYYINNHLDQVEPQLIPMRKAEEFYKRQDWEKCYEQIASARSLYPDGYFTLSLKKAEKNVGLLIEYENFLFDIYLESNQENVTIEAFRCAQLLAEFNPTKYAAFYKERYYSKVKDAIQKYDDFYLAIESGEEEKCIELIKGYGWCWFELHVQDMLLNSKDEELLTLLNKYIGNETSDAAKKCLNEVWGINDMVFNAIEKLENDEQRLSKSI